jgi:hypothetical protein
MVLIESTNLANMCDYTFGDQASIINNIHGGFMKEANDLNLEFIEKYKSIKMSGKNVMTLFIDNIRLYNRDIKFVKDSDRPYVNNLLSKNDLLVLCAKFPYMNFIIFTGFEDTPIDDFIFDKIPENVLGVFAVNSISFGGKVHPIPYGLQRKLSSSDNRLNVMTKTITDYIQPTKLLYVNHSIKTNPNERMGINEWFIDKPWSTVDTYRIDYETFLNKIKNHKFMVCPIGNAIDCHRNWEVLYLKRVPIMKKNKYLEELFYDFPVLFVNEFSEITEELLIKNDDLYNEALKINYDKLDLYLLFKGYLDTALKNKRI